MDIRRRVIYFIGWFFFRACYTLIWRLKINGLENIPKNTGAVIASNHASLGDPPLIGCTIPWRVYYMAKKELFDIPVLGWIMKQINCFPVDRDRSDLTAVRTAVRIVSKNNILVMFPQGGRRKDGDPRSAQYKSGIGIVAALGRVPIVPCVVVNTGKLGKLARVTVNYLKPVYPVNSGKTGKEAYEAMTDAVMDEINIFQNALNRE